MKSKPFNRTYEELKSVFSAHSLQRIIAFNRTYEELKFDFKEKKFTCGGRLLIVPMRN